MLEIINKIVSTRELRASISLGYLRRKTANGFELMMIGANSRFNCT